MEGGEAPAILAVSRQWSSSAALAASKPNAEVLPLTVIRPEKPLRGFACVQKPTPRTWTSSSACAVTGCFVHLRGVKKTFFLKNGCFLPPFARAGVS